jgi:hypothetical protein
LAGWLGLVAVDLLVRALSGYDIAGGVNCWIVHRGIWLAIFIYIRLAIFLGLVASALVGELVIHALMEGSIRGILGLLNFIDKKTPTGTTGILGFILMFCGLSVK